MTKLDEEGFKNVDAIAPFIEDALDKDEEDVKLICLGLLAGDLIRIAPKKYRQKQLNRIINLVKTRWLSLENLLDISKEIYAKVKITKAKKRVLAVGEVLVLFNDFLNNFTFSNLEDQGYRVVYSPFLFNSKLCIIRYCLDVLFL